MKRGLGFISLLGALLAGIHLTSGPRLESGGSAVPPVMAAPLQEPGRVEETCEAFESPTGGLSQTSPTKDSPDKGEITALVQRFLGTQVAGELQPEILPRDLRIAIATVPDPVHTHLSLQFDRTLEAIQQAAQDQGYTYDSSWLPWTMRGAEYSSYSDVNTEAAETVARERCPGIILFRRDMYTSLPLNSNCRSEQAPGPANSGDPYGCGMVVLVVAEEPTAGLNILEWNNALCWIKKYAKEERTDKALRILGPVFSGSIPSFVRALGDVERSSTSFTSILLYSGRIRGCASWRWLRVMLSNQAQPGFKLPLRSADFEENDARQIDHFYRYLEDRGHSISEVAILSEDETAYGGLPDAGLRTRTGTPTKPKETNLPPPCVTREADPDTKTDTKTDTLDARPVHLYYPRDISAIRSAYQEQSIFSSDSGSNSASTPHTVLRPEPGQSPARHTDTVEPLSGQNLALTEEAQLYGIVSICKTHGIRYIVLRSTNDLDYLFLARFLHRAYPAAYLVTTGSDMLFGREIDSTEFRGVLALSNYPLMPRGQDWTLQINNVPQHAHRVFGSYTMEGTYLATRFLIRDEPPSQGQDELQPYTHLGQKDLPDYAPPFWDSTVKDGTPSIWLAVVGRGGYWPVALLDKPSHSAPSDGFSNLAIISGTNRSGTDGREPAKPDPWKFTLSAPWRFGCLLTLVAVAIHLFAVRWGWDHQDLGVFVQFTPLRGSRGQMLMALGGVIISAIPFLMFFAAFRMYPWLGFLDHCWTWSLAFAAMAACTGSVLAIGKWQEDGAVAEKAIQAGFAGASCGNLPDLKHRIYPVRVLMVALVAFCACMLIIFEYHSSFPNGVAIAYRSVNLGSGVSPVVSLLLLLLGLYWWFWQTLCGLALLGDGRPVLPEKNNLPLGLSRVSHEMARNIEEVAIPFPNGEGSVWLYRIPLFVIVLQIAVMQRDWSQKFDLVLHSLENSPFNWLLHLLFWTSLYLLSLECVQLLMTWFSLKRLLVALNRLPLRRTFAALQGLSMRSLWSLSGTSSRARYNVFSHQLESLVHLGNELESFESRTFGDQALREELDNALEQGFGFVKDRCGKLDVAMLNDDKAYHVRMWFSRATEKIICSLYHDSWRQERTSLDLNEAAEEGTRQERLPLSEDGAVRLAEEVVCMIYVGYLQNMLARMRTMVLSIAGIFAAIALSVAFYPYTPRPTIALALMLLLLGIGLVVSHVCAGLDRDTTLSHITNTEPGSLGGHFWLRILGFLGVPALGLLVAQFPEITDLVSSWVQPSLNAMK
jgi:hypothetical protein